MGREEGSAEARRGHSPDLALAENAIGAIIGVRVTATPSGTMVDALGSLVRRSVG